ncbi:MAG: CaiB/BaiF CoA-transferase family protein [Candidatus Pelagadaptatus aseana]|uniref:CaiB/BaiF CoA transferase family protein n=1 Tax=Candidatus Pelagadaptatus aseana TaxID=3120508 RepID=UPI0039B16B35
MGALSHLKVLDLSRVLAGPWSSQILADLGAEVIKVEHPEGGDDTRKWGPPFLDDVEGNATSESAYFICTNRNKKSVCIDMRTEQGQQRLHQLIAESDILLENFKVGGLAKYGLDYASLSQLHPRLIYCSITGFGQTGPYKDRPGYDFLVQAMGGLMSVTGLPDGEPGAGPQKVGVALTDIMTGLYATIGILAALADRERTGQGQQVDLALLDVTAATLANQASNYLVGNQVPGRLGNAHPNIVPYQSFATADGHCIIAVGNDGQFQRLLEVLGLDHLKSDVRFTTNQLRVLHRDELIPLLQEVLLKQGKWQWLAALEQAKVPAGPINTIDEVFADPQIQARDMVVELPHESGGQVKMAGNPIKLSRTPVEYKNSAPLLGQHSR